MKKRTAYSGFTLIELILVMIIIATAAAMVVPSLRAFTIARTTDNAASMLLGVAQYARSQSVSEGRNYRMNFDIQAGTVWLTRMDNGVYDAPTSDFTEPFTIPKGMTMTVEVGPRPTTLMIKPQDVDQTTGVPTPLFGQAIAPANSVLQNQHQSGLYIEFLPSGRCDPALITLRDKLGKEIDLGNATATEPLHILTKGEL